VQNERTNFVGKPLFSFKVVLDVTVIDKNESIKQTKLKVANVKINNLNLQRIYVT